MASLCELTMSPVPAFIKTILVFVPGRPRPFQLGWATALGVAGVCVGSAAAVSLSDQPPSPRALVATSYRHDASGSAGSSTSPLGAGFLASQVVFRGLDPWLGGAAKHAPGSSASKAKGPPPTTDTEAADLASTDSASTRLAACGGVALAVSDSVQGMRRSMEDDFDLAAGGHFAAVKKGRLGVGRLNVRAGDSGGFVCWRMDGR